MDYAKLIIKVPKAESYLGTTLVFYSLKFNNFNILFLPYHVNLFIWSRRHKRHHPSLVRAVNKNIGKFL